MYKNIMFNKGLNKLVKKYKAQDILDNHNSNNMPPDLDQVWKNFVCWIKKNLGLDKNNNLKNNKTFHKILLYLSIIILMFYLIFGLYTIASYEQGVVTRFGAYRKTVLSGLHWIPRIIEDFSKVNTENIKSSRHSGWMITKDENILFAEIEVQYKILDVRSYLFNITQPDNVLAQAADSALRQVIGNSLIDDVLTNFNQSITEFIKEHLIYMLKLYNVGLHIEAVNFRDYKLPEDVKDAFHDVHKSYEDKEKLKLQAKAYAHQLITEAEGAACKIIAEAEAYKSEVVLNAIGETQRFNLIVSEYFKEPKITKYRMYINTMQKVFSNTTKIIIHSDIFNNFPFNKKIIQQPLISSALKGFNK